MQESAPSDRQSSESESSTSKPKRGRPKGTKNTSLLHVVDFPKGCPVCSSTEYSVLNTPRQMDTHVQYEGKEYNRITWRRCRCSNCGQVYMRRSYRTL